MRISEHFISFSQRVLIFHTEAVYLFMFMQEMKNKTINYVENTDCLLNFKQVTG